MRILIEPRRYVCWCRAVLDFYGEIQLANSNDRTRGKAKTLQSRTGNSAQPVFQAGLIDLDGGTQQHVIGCDASEQHCLPPELSSALFFASAMAFAHRCTRMACQSVCLTAQSFLKRVQLGCALSK
jgi:hypothetical protein